jgi:ribosome-associated protein
VARQVAIRGESIRLGQLLKLAGVADSGSDAKALLADGAVSVNGMRETRRGRRLLPGDSVAVGAQELAVVAAHDAGPAAGGTQGPGDARPR